jgi:hypothetical protein
MYDSLVVVYENADEIGELLVRDAFYVQEEFYILSLDLRNGLNVYLASPDSKSLYFNIEVWGPGFLSPE